MVYVVYSNKKLVQKTLKELGHHLDVLSWSELLALHNRKASKKKEHITDEVFSLQFDTSLNSVKGKPGLKQCVFVISNIDIESVLSKNFNILEINL